MTQMIVQRAFIAAFQADVAVLRKVPLVEFQKGHDTEKINRCFTYKYPLYTSRRAIGAHHIDGKTPLKVASLHSTPKMCRFSGFRIYLGSFLPDIGSIRSVSR